ncbi:MAG TPA: hypothetical protein VFR81_09115 [Longimicrobium sp.]|nr:hypothetical protein [Longimicrobium sp.]
MAGEPVDPAGGDADLLRRATPAERRVAALAEEGRVRQAAALAAEKAEERRIERSERRQVERLGRANVRNSLLDSPRGPAPPLLALACGAVVLGTVLLFLADGVLSAVGLGLILLAIGGFFGGRWIVGRRLVRVERAWLLSLPFSVRGYFRVLGATPSEETRIRVRIRFREAAPEREVLDGLLGRVQYPASARLTGGSGLAWKAESGPIRTLMVEDGTPTNLSSLSWMRSVIDEALLPLHEAYPLRGVEFRG